MFIFQVGQTALSVSLVPRTVILVFPCQSFQTYFHFHLLSQAKQNTQLLSMQLIIFKALSGSDLLSGPLVGNPYSKEGKPEDRWDVYLFICCFFLPQWKRNYAMSNEEKQIQMSPSVLLLSLAWEFSAVFPFQDVSRGFGGDSDQFFVFYPTKIDKAVGDFSRS